MATFHQTFSEQQTLSRIALFVIGAFFSIHAFLSEPVVFAQTGTMADATSGQPSLPPSPRLESGLQFFGSTEEISDTRSSQAEEEKGTSSSPPPDEPYVGEEGIPVMEETVVEGSTVDSFDDPFDEGPAVIVQDPWESFNSETFQFNYNLDRYLMKPVARGYNAVVPPDVQGSLSNAFDNMGYVTRLLNSLFQGKYGRASIETKRFLINTTIGIGGLFDVAKYVFDTEAPPAEDTGQTLAVHGMDSGPFLVLPFLPPLTVRDAVGYAGDIALNPVNYFIPFFTNLGINAEDTINDRSQNLETFEGIEESTVDLYGAVRSGYFQRRAKDIAE